MGQRALNALPSQLDGIITSHRQTMPSEDAEANSATDCDIKMPVRHVTLFLCTSGT